MSGFLHYSTGTDTSGSRLASVLEYDSGKKAPNFESYSVYIGWGCRKPKSSSTNNLLDDLIRKRKIKILNHPHSILENRDKVLMLEKLKNAGVERPGFFVCGEPSKGVEKAVAKAVGKGVIAFPITGHTRDHRGAPFFCFTPEDIHVAFQEAKDTGREIDYFRSFVPGTEYRIHVLRDSAIVGQVKTRSSDAVNACARDLRETLTKKARASKRALDTQTMAGGTVKWILDVLAQEMLQGSNHIQRSINRGWDLEEVSLGDLPHKITVTAVAALDAVGLDLGAVSIVYDDKRATVTNITTGPVLKEEHLDRYRLAITEFAGNKIKKSSGKDAPKTKIPSEEEANPELIAQLVRRLSGVSKEKAIRALDALKS
jgi:hypothetical protein